MPAANWRFGAIAVLCFSFVVFMPYEIYKAQRKHKNFLQLLADAVCNRVVHNSYYAEFTHGLLRNACIN